MPERLPEPEIIHRPPGRYRDIPEIGNQSNLWWWEDRITVVRDLMRWESELGDRAWAALFSQSRPFWFWSLYSLCPMTLIPAI